MLSGAEIRLLTEVGFVAAGHGWVEHARTIFGSLIRLRPARAFPYIGLALALINTERAEEAVTVLAQARAVMNSGTADAAREPDSMAALESDRALLSAYYGLALRYSGRLGESVRELHSLIDRPAGDAAGRIARSMLGMPDAPEKA